MVTRPDQRHGHRKRTWRLSRRRRGRFPVPGEVIRSRSFGWALIVLTLAAMICVPIAIWAKEQAKVAPGRVALQTRILRAPLSITDSDATESARASARLATPSVFRREAAVLDEIETALTNLPQALGTAQTLDEIEPGITSSFGLSEETLALLRDVASTTEGQTRWAGWIRKFVALMERTPLLSSREWQVEVLAGGQRGLLTLADAAAETAPIEDAVNASDAERVRTIALGLALRSGMPEKLASVVATRVASDGRPTFRADPDATAAARALASSEIEPLLRELPRRTVMVYRGDVIEAEQADLIRREQRAYLKERSALTATLERGATATLVVASLVGIGLYLAIFCPRIRRSPPRMAWLGGGVTLAFAIACVATAAHPGLVMLLAPAPVLLLAILIVIAYDERTSLAVGAMTAVMVTLSLGLTVGWLVVVVSAMGVSAIQLGDIRDRNALIRMGISAAGAMAGATVIATLVTGPVNGAMLAQLLPDALQAGLGGLIAGGLTMFALPTIERAFAITTGMSLIELRDPKQPLLRQLQQRAAGTYNHSLNVASIAEAAADAIGANGLLTYVCGLYHDIGKMNKPGYFVENQGGGPNKHDKLSPAMSLLVIVGHVKDGVELGREWNLPKPILHAIEAHHGTTLVEYFYRRAQQKAQQKAGADGEPVAKPEEFEYRYPGPKPRTKEVAILMLADAVESATRTLAEPTPSRIDALVRSIAERRLLDGQFDECNLTLAEVRQIEASISKTVASIYHGRIAYPPDQAARERKVAPDAIPGQAGNAS